MNGVRVLCSVFLCLEKLASCSLSSARDAKRKCTTAESCAKNLVRNLLSLKISICEVFMHVLKMTWFLGFLKVLGRSSRLVFGNSRTAQTKSQMHKYGKLLSLSKLSTVRELCPTVICVVWLLAVSTLEVYKLMFQKLICKELSELLMGKACVVRDQIVLF